MLLGLLGRQVIREGFGECNRMKESPTELNWACETWKYKQQVVRGVMHTAARWIVKLGYKVRTQERHFIMNLEALRIRVSLEHCKSLKV